MSVKEVKVSGELETIQEVIDVLLESKMMWVEKHQYHLDYLQVEWSDEKRSYFFRAFFSKGID